ncbi:MAG: PH domain-containing protein [Clostridia bacterium]|nr:PH domain-containing protein [Clostridia bacterium]
MIDFKNASFFKLSQVPVREFTSLLEPLMINGEHILSAYQTVRDGIVFTNLRIFAINVQGVTGRKIDVTSIPYKSIKAFSVESAGSFDNDSELDVFVSAIGNIRFEFVGESNMELICKTISACCL